VVDDIRQWTMLKIMVKLNEVLRIVSLGRARHNTSNFYSRR